MKGRWDGMQFMELQKEQQKAQLALAKQKLATPDANVKRFKFVSSVNSEVSKSMRTSSLVVCSFLVGP